MTTLATMTTSGSWTNYSREGNVMSETKPKKKSVALSGVQAGTTAVCTVGHSGNDLHYRGYDILELAEKSTFEEVAYLLIHGNLPTQSELADYQKKLIGLRGLPAQLKAVLEQIPSSAHPMDVMRTGCSMLGTLLPESSDRNLSGCARHRRPAGGIVRLDAAALVPLFAQRPLHRGGNRG